MASSGSKKSQVPAAPPRKINVQKFVESRASELEALHSIVANRLNNDFRSRRNKRRRTTAHDNQIAKNRHRKRCKLVVGDTGKDMGLEKDQKKVPRRIRRRTELKKNPEAGFVTSGDGTKRVRTHVWHAKRFTMKKLWGFHLPLGLQGRGRGSRALLKWYRNGALVHDASYYGAVQLEGPQDSLLSILRMIMVPSPSTQSEDIFKSILSGVIYGTAMIHHVGAPDSRLICPVTYMWRPCHQRNIENVVNVCDSDGCNEPQSSESSFSRMLWVWIHASAFSEGYDTLKLACQKEMNECGIFVNCLSLEGQLAKLEVMGLKAFQLLQKTLCPISCNAEKPWQLKKCLLVEGDNDSRFDKPFAFESEENIPLCSIISLTVKDPRLLPEKGIADMLVSAPAGVNVSADEAKEHVPLLGTSGKNTELFPPSWSKPEVDCSFSDHNNLWDVSSGVNPPVEENVLCLERHHLRMDYVCFDNPKSEMLKNSTKVQGSRSCPILLLKNNGQMSPLMGWSVILPLSWAKVFWIPFVSKGAHAIGLREKRWVACEVGLPYFPSDFPDCTAYSSFMVAEGASSEQKEEQLPPSVRPFKVPIPPPWNVVGTPPENGHTQVFREEWMVDGNSSLNSKYGHGEITPLDSHGNSFDGIVARTSIVLTDFLKEIHGDHLLLFPGVPKGKERFLKMLKDESKLGQSQDHSNQIASNHKLCFLRVLLHAFSEGVFEEGAVVCAPCLSDISLWTSGVETTDGKLQLPQSSVSSYFKEQCPGKWELHVPGDPAGRESHRRPIGFITTGFVRGSKKAAAEAFCEAVLLAQLREEQWNNMPVKRRRKEIFVLVRNLRSSAYRLGLGTIVLEKQEADVEFL